MTPESDSSMEPQTPAQDDVRKDWVAHLARLQEALTICPTDTLARAEFAILLEQLGQHEEALFNWKAVLACDPNNLTAREGMARCRQRTGRPLQSLF